MTDYQRHCRKAQDALLAGDHLLYRAHALMAHACDLEEMRAALTSTTQTLTTMDDAQDCRKTVDQQFAEWEREYDQLTADEMIINDPRELSKRQFSKGLRLARMESALRRRVGA